MGIFCGVVLFRSWLGSLLAGEEPFPAFCSSVALPRASFPILPGTTVPEPLPTTPGGSRLRASFVPHELQPLNRLGPPTNSCRPAPANPADSPGPDGGFRLLTNRSVRATPSRSGCPRFSLRCKPGDSPPTPAYLRPLETASGAAGPARRRHHGCGIAWRWVPIPPAPRHVLPKQLLLGGHGRRLSGGSPSQSAFLTRRLPPWIDPLRHRQNDGQAALDLRSHRLLSGIHEPMELVTPPACRRAGHRLSILSSPLRRDHSTRCYASKHPDIWLANHRRSQPPV